MGKHIYENGHINAIQPYYFMYNGQRYNAAHFNGNIVFGKFDEVEPTVPPTVPPTPTPEPPTTTPFYVENITNSTETLLICGSNLAPVITIDYSYDGQTWTRFGIKQDGNTLSKTIAPGERLYLRGNRGWATYNSNNFPTVGAKILGISSVGGNIMSLSRGSRFTGEETILNTNEGWFGLFDGTGYQASELISAENLLLPATNLWNSKFCYSQMFHMCEQLLYSPETLPATRLQQGCYYDMFGSCTSLITTPTMDATSISDAYYVSQTHEYMFASCTSLTTAPDLPATTIGDRCYASMFQGCTSLTTAPSLPATILKQECYLNMFRNCNNINRIICLASDISAARCTENWLLGTSPTGAFVKATGTTWSTGYSGIPNGWTVQSV